MKFRPKNQNELAKLEDEGLVAYLVSARNAGDPEAMSGAVYALVERRTPMVQGMVARKAPPHRREELVADIISEAVISASKSFQGEHVGEFVNFIRTVASRKIADSTDRNNRQIQAGPLDNEDESPWKPEPEADTGDPGDIVALREAIDNVMATRNETHRKIIIMRRAGIPSKQVVSKLEGQSVANVDKVFSRFAKDLRKELGHEQ